VTWQELIVMNQPQLPLNESLLKDLELTSSDIHDFGKLLFDFQKKNQSQQDECQGYCQGDIYKWLGAYNGIHGYVSLLVSTVRPVTRSSNCDNELPGNSLANIVTCDTVLIILMSSCHKPRHFSLWPVGWTREHEALKTGRQL